MSLGRSAFCLYSVLMKFENWNKKVEKSNLQQILNTSRCDFITVEAETQTCHSVIHTQSDLSYFCYANSK